MAKKTATAKAQAAKKPATAKGSLKKAAKKTAAKKTPAKKLPAKKSPAKKPAAKKKAGPAKKPSGRTSARTSQAGRKKRPVMAVKEKSAGRSQKTTAGTSPVEKQAAESYLAALGGLSRDAVASLRKMMQKAAPDTTEPQRGEHAGPLSWIKEHAPHVNLGFWRGVELPDPRKLLHETGERMRHIKLSRLKQAGKKELEELVRVASKLNELRAPSPRPARKKSKHK